MSDELGENGVDADIDHTAGGALLGVFLVTLSVEELVACLAEAVENVRVKDVCDMAEAIRDQPIECLGGILQAHKKLYRCGGRLQCNAK